MVATSPALWPADAACALRRCAADTAADSAADSAGDSEAAADTEADRRRVRRRGGFADRIAVGWRVENQCHHTWDTVFAEDHHLWIVSDKHGAAPRAVVCLMLLRRIAYNMMAVFRAVTQRSDARRQTPWRDVLRWVYRTLIAATDTDARGLHPRAASVA